MPHGTITSDGVTWGYWVALDATASEELTGTWSTWTTSTSSSTAYTEITQLDWDIAKKERSESQERAEALLRETLNEDQRAQYDEHNWFLVLGQSGKRYRILDNWAGNIEELDEKNYVVARYCIHPERRVPVEDSMLIQKLMLELEEDRLIEIANRSELEDHPADLGVWA